MISSAAVFSSNGERELKSNTVNLLTENIEKILIKKERKTNSAQMSESVQQNSDPIESIWQEMHQHTKFVNTFMGSLLKIKVLHDAIEEHFCLNGSIKNL